ncbi:MAG: phosphatase PAP2 family protein [Bacteroidetes bacterium]|nr:phosphatase PAP2 family protein [Bacteroidota bacterium]
MKNVIEFLYSIDVTIFFFFNHTIANPVLDVVFPFLTDLNKQLFVVWGIIIFILYLFIKGNANTRAMIVLLIITIIAADQLSSSLIKQFFERLRPCRALEGVRMLVPCGSGYSFPSSHAVNNFAGAVIITRFFQKQKIFWFSFASLIAVSRPYVGVHYPSDIIAGAIIGSITALCIFHLWKFINLSHRKLLSK